MWLLVFAVVGVSTAALVWAMRHARHEVPALLAAFEALHRDVRPALVRVQTETEAARARLGRE
jgi:hypothetical protein